MRTKKTFKNIIAYLQGHIRYKLYYSYLKFLIPLHIREQIVYRINSMNKECYNQGSCIMCGCRTTHLQMANKSCDNPCYPAMVKKRTWNFWKTRPKHQIDVGSNHVLWNLNIIKNKFIKNELEE